MEATKYFPTIEAIDKASEVLGEILEPTPFLKNNNLSDIYEANVFLKREDLQMVRSYKIRGAYNKIRSIAPETLKKGIVCASAGNHAQGVAFSCSKLQIIGSIFMPTTTPKQKIEQVKMFGREFIEIVLTGDTFDAANAAAIAFAEESGRTFIPPFDDPKVMEGQGTIGREILNQTNTLAPAIAEKARLELEGAFGIKIGKEHEENFVDSVGIPYADEQFNRIIEFMSGFRPDLLKESEYHLPGKVKSMVLVYEGRNAVSKIRDVLGPIDPTQAPGGTIRREFGHDVMVNTAQSSDSEESFLRESRILKIQNNNMAAIIRKYLQEINQNDVK